MKAPCTWPVNTTSPGTRYDFLRHASLSAGHAASSSEPLTKLTCERAVIREATRGRFMSKSIPRHAFGSESASAGKAFPKEMHPSTSIGLKALVGLTRRLPFIANFPR